jgi:hypothetical protein
LGSGHKFGLYQSFKPKFTIMKRILTLMALLAVLIVAMPANAGPVDTDVGISYVISQDEQSTQDVAIRDMTFISVINPGEPADRGYLLRPEPVFLPGPEASLKHDAYAQLFNNGPPIRSLTARPYPCTGLHSSGGISY